MAKHLLSAMAVKNARDGELGDGEGLLLRIHRTRASWVFRFTASDGRRRELGLGALDRSSLDAAGASLKRARARADEARQMLSDGVDPIEAKRADERAESARAAEGQAPRTGQCDTLRHYARAYHARHIEPIRTGKHGQQWINSIEQHVPAAILDAPLDRIAPIDLLDSLVPVLRRVPETGSRVYQRLATVFDAAVIDRLRPDNPATPIRRELRKRAGRRERSGFAAMTYVKVPEFVRGLRKAPGSAARCLEFAILTAARTSEALNAEWAEFDLAARTWTVPAARMKARQAHVVFLSDRVLQLLEDQKGYHDSLVFPSSSNFGLPLSNMALLMTLRRLGAGGVTTHGFRASFSTWANETGAARPDVIEAALAHNEVDRIRRAYNRSQFLQERRALMAAWSAYVSPEKSAPRVVSTTVDSLDNRQGGESAFGGPG
jgi:integrase